MKIKLERYKWLKVLQFTIEYYAPAGVVQTPIIEVSTVVYYYRGVEDFVNPFIEEALDYYGSMKRQQVVS